MLVIQLLSLKSASPWTNVVKKIPGGELGLKVGMVEVFQKGDVLFFTQDYQIPISKGFVRWGSRKVFYTQKYAKITPPPEWVKKYCSENTHVRAYYTDIGVFLRPYYGGADA